MTVKSIFAGSIAFVLATSLSAAAILRLGSGLRAEICTIPNHHVTACCKMHRVKQVPVCHNIGTASISPEG